MIYAIKILLDRLPITYKLWHVMGHQDNHKGLKELDEIAQAKVIVYDLAKMAGD